MNRRLVLLAVVVVALAVWLFVFDLPGEAQRKQRTADESVLLDFDPARVDTLRVVRDLAPWKLARRPTEDGRSREWWLVRPIEERAEPRFAENALELLSSYTASRRVADEVTDDAWSRYGLSDGHPSRMDFVLDLEDGERLVLKVGIAEPTGHFVYVRRGDDPGLDLATSELADLAMSPHHGFRRPRLFDIDAEEIARLEIVSTSMTWTAERDSSTGLWWTWLGDERRRVRRWELDDLAYSVADLSVVQYQRDGITDAQWAGYGLDQPWARLIWTGWDGRSGRLDLGNETEERRYFGRRGDLDSVFELLPGFESIFDRDPRSWIDENPIARNVRRANTIRIEDENGDWVRQQRTGPSGKDWEVTTARGPVPATEYLFVSARNVALGLEEVQASATLLLARDQAADPDNWGRRGPRVRLSWPEGPDVELVLWWRAEDNAPWLQVDDTPTLHRVDRGLFMRLRAMIDAAHSGG